MKMVWPLKITTCMDMKFLLHLWIGNAKGHKCQDNSGLLVDQMNYWAKRYNFTWDVMTAYGNDWGLYPKSGELCTGILLGFLNTWLNYFKCVQIFCLFFW